MIEEEIFEIEKEMSEEAAKRYEQYIQENLHITANLPKIEHFDSKYKIAIYENGNFKTERTTK